MLGSPIVSPSEARSLSRALVGRPSVRLAWWISLAVFSLLGGLWAVSSPLMSVPDEPAHTIKAVALAHGQLRGRDERVVSANPGNPERLDTHVTVPRAYAELDQQRACYNFSPTTPAGCAPAVGTDMTLVDATSYTGTYPPLYYAMVGWPSRLLTPYRALYAMRLCSVLVCSALLASALVSLRQVAPGGAGMAAIALSVTPIVVFLMGSINPSGFEIAAAFAAWASLLDLLCQRGRPSARLVTRVVVATTCFAAARPLSPLFAVLVVGAVVLASARRPRIRELAHDRRVQVGTTVLLVGFVVSTGWVLWSKTYDSFAGSPQPGLTFRVALHHAIDLEPWHTRQMYGVFGWLDSPAPWRMALPWLLVALAMAVVALLVGSWRQRAILASWLVGCVVLPLVAEANRAAAYGYIWQGRYTLPLAVGVPVLAAWIIAQPGRLPRRLLEVASLLIIAGMAVGQLIAHGIALTRYSVAIPGRQAFGYLGGHGWRPPVNLWLLALIAVVATAAYGLWLGVLTRDRQTRR